MAADALSNLNLQTCDLVDVTYHQNAGLLVADSVTVTGTSTAGDCAPTMDTTGVITQVSADVLTLKTDSGPLAFSVDPSSGLTSGFQAGDLVDVTYTQVSDGTLTATNVQFVEQNASGQVTSVTTSVHGGSLTLTDSDTRQPETFVADPSNGVQINSHAFNGVSVGDQIEGLLPPVGGSARGGHRHRAVGRRAVTRGAASLDLGGAALTPSAAGRARSGLQRPDSP
jgi:hypothetical protein